MINSISSAIIYEDKDNGEGNGYRNECNNRYNHKM